MLSLNDSCDIAAQYSGNEKKSYQYSNATPDRLNFAFGVVCHFGFVHLKILMKILKIPASVASCELALGRKPKTEDE